MPSGLTTMGLMPLLSLLLSSALQVQARDGPLLSRDYLAEVCMPDFDPETDVIPPCANIEYIERACQPNGTSPLALSAHQQCMCGGSYFPEWLACLNCQYFHGERSPRLYSYYQTVLSAASTSFCGVPTPTAEFESIFSSQDDVATKPTGGATAVTDRAVSQTAVSLYYTPTGKQGPGAITGPAASATVPMSTMGTISPMESSGPGSTTIKSSDSQITHASSASSAASSAASSVASTTTSSAARPARMQVGGMLAVALLMSGFYL